MANGPILVIVIGDFAAAERLARSLPAHAPAALDLDGLRALSPGSRAFTWLHLADAGWLNINRPIIRARSLQLFAFVHEDEAEALRGGAPDFWDWASHVTIADPAPPDWLVTALRRLEPGLYAVADDGGAAEAVRALGGDILNLNPSSSWRELRAAARAPGWRFYHGVRDRWTRERAVWVEAIEPRGQPALLLDSAGPTCRNPKPTGGTAGEVANSMVGWGTLLRIAPARLGPDAARALWASGHADIAVDLLATGPEGETIRRRADELGAGAAIAERFAPSARTRALRAVWKGLGAIMGGVVAAGCCGLLGSPALLLVGLWADLAVGNGAAEQVMAAALLLFALVYTLILWRERPVDPVKSLREEARPTTWFTLERLEPADLDAAEELACLHYKEHDTLWISGFCSGQFRHVQPELVHLRHLDLVAGLLVDKEPEEALSIWENIVGPGFARAQERGRGARVNASIALLRYRRGDLAGALAAASAAPTEAVSAKVAARVHAARNEPAAAVTALASSPETAALAEPANLAHLADIVPLPRTRIGARWLK